MSSSVVQNPTIENTMLTENVIVEESSTSVAYPEMVSAPEAVVEDTNVTEVPSIPTVVETSSVPMCEENPTQFERIRKQVQNTCKEVENDKIVKTIVTETGNCASAVGRVVDRVGNELLGKHNVEQESVVVEGTVVTGTVVTETVVTPVPEPQEVANPSEEITTNDVTTNTVPTTTPNTQYVYVTHQNNKGPSIERDIVNGVESIGRGLVNICDDILGSSRRPVIVVQPVAQPGVAQTSVAQPVPQTSVAQPVPQTSVAQTSVENQIPIVMNQTPIVMQSTVGTNQTSPNRQRPVARQIVAQ